MTPDRIPALELAARELVEATANLAVAVTAVNAKVERARKEARRTWLATCAVLVLIAGQLLVDTLFFGVYSHRSDAVNAIRDCTTPTGQCYQQSQRSTSGALEQIRRTNIAILLCGRDSTIQTPADMLACVKRHDG